MNVTVTSATPDTVEWYFPGCLKIESSRDAVEAWAAQLRHRETVHVDGLPLSRADVANMHAAMDEAALQADSLATDPIHDYLTGGL